MYNISYAICICNMKRKLDEISKKQKLHWWQLCWIVWIWNIRDEMWMQYVIRSLWYEYAISFYDINVWTWVWSIYVTWLWNMYVTPAWNIYVTWAWNMYVTWVWNMNVPYQFVISTCDMSMEYEHGIWNVKFSKVSAKFSKFSCAFNVQYKFAIALEEMNTYFILAIAFICYIVLFGDSSAFQRYR